MSQLRRPQKRWLRQRNRCRMSPQKRRACGRRGDGVRTHPHRIIIPLSALRIARLFTSRETTRRCLSLSPFSHSLSDKFLSLPFCSSGKISDPFMTYCFVL